MMPVLQIGPAAIRLPGLLILGGVWIGSLTLDAEARRNGLSPDRLSKLVFFSILVGLLSARLGYVLEHLAAYAPDPGGVFSLSPYTLSLPEGVAGGLIFAWIYGRRQNLPFWETADAVTPMVAVIGVFLALAHLASGDAFGAPARVPWAIELWGEQRHPSQVYELLSGLLVLGAIFALRRHRRVAGTLFLAWAVMASASRLLLEAFRGDSTLVFGTLRAAQVASLLILLLSLGVLHLRLRAFDLEGGAATT